MTIWRSLAVLLHAIGHLLFLLPLTNLIGALGQSTHSWLLGDSSLAHWIGVLIFAAALALFVLVAQAVFKDLAWQQIALWAAVISQAGLILFWSTPLPAGVLPASLFNLAIVLAAMLLR